MISGDVLNTLHAGLLFLFHCWTPHFAIPTQLRKDAEAEMNRSYEVELPAPWERESLFTQLLLHDKDVNGRARFHVLDPWHLLHLGIGKSFTASALMVVQQTVDESTVGKRIHVLSIAYRQFCRKRKLTPYLKKLDIHTLGGEDQRNR